MNENEVVEEIIEGEIIDEEGNVINVDEHEEFNEGKGDEDDE